MQLFKKTLANKTKKEGDSENKSVAHHAILSFSFLFSFSFSFFRSSSACFLPIIFRTRGVLGNTTHNTPEPCRARTFSKMSDGPNEFKLEQPPSDGITAVKFSPSSSNFALASSWDSVSETKFYLCVRKGR